MDRRSEHPGNSYDTVCAALHSAGLPVRPRGASALMASCPLHTDDTPSLSVTWRDGSAGRPAAVLLHCFSCQASAADITAALGLRMSDLFDTAPPQRNRPTTRRVSGRAAPRPAPAALPARITAARPPAADHRWRRVRVYTYTDAHGRPVQQVIRHECDCPGGRHKRFTQRYRVGRQWVYRKPDGFSPVLYRPAAIRTAASSGAWLFVVEGEKDADTLTRLGRLATTNPQGAGSFPAELTAELAGLNVAVVADRDLAGYRRAQRLCEQLRDIAAQVVVLVAALDTDKADLTDHVEAHLWDRGDTFGGLITLTAADLHGLALAAAARQAAGRLEVALAEAAAHRALPVTARSRAAAARWREEATQQRRTLGRLRHDLQRHHNTHLTAITAYAARTVAALLHRGQHTHHHGNPSASAAGPNPIKESA